MGRKIPAKKHRGVKDPLVQLARREKSLKSKINAPPKDPDDQPIPKSFTRLFGFQNKDKLVEKPKKKNNLKRLHHQDNDKSGVGDNPIARLRKLPGESGRGFSLRINSAVKALHGEVTEDDYYPQDVDEDDVKGDRMADFKEYRAKKIRRATGGRKPEPKEAKPTRTQKEALKKKARQEKQQETLKERQELVYERVAFGDISHAPPTLHFKNKRLQAAGGAPRTLKERQQVVYERVAFGDISHAPPTLHFKNRRLQAAGSAPRPGRRDLLLTKLLSGSSSSTASDTSKSSKPASAADALRRERARLDAVQAYRDLKANRLKTVKTNKKS